MLITLVAVNGSYSHTNLAVRCLRRGLESNNFDVSIAEYNLHDRTQHILEALYAKGADVYGFSAYIWNITLITELSRELKKLRPDARIIWGGPEVSYETERFSELGFLDCVICGEGEDAIVDICRKFERGEKVEQIYRASLAENVMSDEGILYRDGETDGGKLLYYESSRGCPFSCAYCLSSALDGIRMKSLSQVLADLEEFEKLSGGCKVLKFVDRTFNADVKRANGIWKALLDEKFTLKYHFEICATLLNEESFDLLSRMPKGKIQLEVGLQSTNPDTLGAVSRHLDPQKVIKNTKRISDMGNIDVYLDLIAGLPYEDIGSFARSFDDAYFASTRLQVGFLKLLPGTALRRDAEKYGMVYLDSAPYTVMKTKWLSFEDISLITRVHELLERYCESRKFDRSLDYIYGQIDSPFAFWSGFAKYIAGSDGREIQKLSQPDAYRLLCQYAPVEKSGLKSCLRADFEGCEHRSAPAFLN